MAKKNNKLSPIDDEYYYKEFQKEILLSEQRRVTIFAVITFLVMFVFLLLSILVDYERVTDYSSTPIYISIFIALFFVAREFFVRGIISKKIKEAENFPYVIRFINTAFEVSFPTIILVVLAYYWQSLVVLSTPIILLYLVIILLTILSLDPKISAFAGFVAAAEFLIVTFLLLYKFEYPRELEILNKPYIHIGKSLIIFISGIIAGIVARQMKNRIFQSYKVVSERERIKNLFGQQVSREIVEELVADNKEIESRRLYVCIMFLDIRGFTPFAEKMEPEEIIDYQNKVFGFMIDEILNNNGVINQFLGDGYMATFGAPISKGNDCQNAVNAALKIIEQINIKNNNNEIPPTNIGIGLHSGYVVAGNVGTDKRKQYSISGNTVILASRIEQLNKEFKSQLLVSQEVLENVELPGTKPVSLGEIDLKGRKEPVRIFKLA